MQPRAFLEKIGKEWMDDFVYVSRFPLEETGYKIVPFEEKNSLLEIYFHNASPKPGDIIVGSVESSCAFFRSMGIDPPKSISYHPEVLEFLHRNISLVKLNDVGEDFPFFIKPASEIKIFTGSVIEKKEHLDLLLKFYEGVTLDTLVWKSPIVEFITEYRCFVNNSVVRGIKHYNGDFRIFPDLKILDQIIEKFKSAPISYTIDIGVDSEGKTSLVELNDMWAIGSYGLSGKIYTKCLKDRIHQITKYGIRPH